MSGSPARTEPYRVLFVCLGNICRSPLAEGVFLHLVEESGLADRYRIDSAGTGAWHAGEDPDERSAEVASRHGIQLRGPARQVEPSDFSSFDLLLAMDRQNLEELHRIRGAKGGAELALLRDFDPSGGEDLAVPDPYYGGADGFEHVYELVHRSCVALLETLEEQRAEREGTGTSGDDAGESVGPHGPRGEKGEG